MAQEFVTDDGVRIVYDDLGSGTPIVLCHGLAAAGEQLIADAEHFAGRGFRVLVPDLRGHGRSGKPETLNRETLAIARLATDLLQMLDHAGAGPVHWVGNSLGGIAALWLLREHEARFKTLATFGTSYRLKLPGFWARGLPLAHALVGARLIAGITARTTTRNVAARPLIAKLVGQFDPHVGAPLTENLADYDLIANGVGAKLPILMLRGGRDGAVNAALGSRWRRWRGARIFRWSSGRRAGTAPTWMRWSSGGRSWSGFGLVGRSPMLPPSPAVIPAHAGTQRWGAVTARAAPLVCTGSRLSTG